MRAGLSILIVSAVVAVGAPAAARDEAASLTPAERGIEQARQSIVKSPDEAGAHVALAMALARRARETSEHSFYEQADAALDKALALEPGNFEALRTRAWVLLGQHRFAQARELAQTLNTRVPDDVMVYGLLTDANAELGDYGSAERACQWMLDLRPGNVPALTRAAYLREMFGDTDGAFELMGSALDGTSPDEAEDRAWILTQMAHLRMLAGGVSDAESLLSHALASFPGYHYALAQLAKVRGAQGRFDDTVALLRQRYETSPHPENLYDLAAALARAGRRSEAERAFDDFEKQALEETHGDDNANRELVFYYADHARRPDAALAVARRTMERRKDVFTLDAYAWALYRSGMSEEAGEAMNSALAVGFEDASVLYRAGAIAARLGHEEEAIQRLSRSLALGPASEVASEARGALTELLKRREQTSGNPETTADTARATGT